jgi:hypothetical protein
VQQCRVKKEVGRAALDAQRAQRRRDRPATAARVEQAHAEKKADQPREESKKEETKQKEEQEATHESSGKDAVAARHSRVPLRGVRCCTSCGRTWDRDTAAAISLLRLGRAEAAGFGRPARFTPGDGADADSQLLVPSVPAA